MFIEEQAYPVLGRYILVDTASGSASRRGDNRVVESINA